MRITTLCNPPLPADLPRPWCQKKEAPLPARILTIIACQTGQDLNRMLEKPVQKWTGCPRTPLEPTTGERHAQKHPWIRVMHSPQGTGSRRQQELPKRIQRRLCWPAKKRQARRVSEGPSMKRGLSTNPGQNPGPDPGPNRRFPPGRATRVVENAQRIRP